MLTRSGHPGRWRGWASGNSIFAAETPAVPILKSYRHGLIGSIPPRNPSPPPPGRGEVKGWSRSAARRNLAFLRSVDERLLSGHGYAITLTLRECPADAQAWAKIRNAWLHRQRRAGLIRLHWVMEMQRRGVPHLHATAWYDTPQGIQPLQDWVEVAESCTPLLKCQQTRDFDGSTRWFMYVSKHVSRGHAHYQRHGLPPGWESSGRVWGHTGDWPVIDPLRHEVSEEAWFRLRRLLRAAAVADARRWLPLNTRPVRRARGSLRCPSYALSRVRGFSEWVSPDLQPRLLEAALRGTGAIHAIPPEPVEQRPAEDASAAGGR